MREPKKILLVVPYFENRSAMAVYAAMKDHPSYELHVLNMRAKDDENTHFDVGSRLYVREDGEQPTASLSRVLRKHDIAQVVPTKDPLVLLCASQPLLLRGKTLLPQYDLVELLQDKMATYEFFEGSGVNVPEFYQATQENEGGIKGLLARKGTAIVKPRTGSSGARVKQFESIDDLALDPRLVVCEELQMPEFNQTYVVKDGVLMGGVCYRSVRDGHQPTTNVELAPEIPQGRIAMEVLLERWGSDAVQGVFNIDFMMGEEGSYVLNEINPGRFPAGAFPLVGTFEELIVAYLQKDTHITAFPLRPTTEVLRSVVL